MIQPLNRQVLVKIEKKPDVSKSGIIIVTQDDPRSEKATVIAFDKDVKIVKKGDTIYFKSYSLSEVELEDELYAFIKEEDILAKDA